MKIGFLAMSGLRAHDPKLLKLGLTFPGILERGKVIATLPSLGLLYLAAVTPYGHELIYLDAEGDGREPSEVYDCDLVAIGTFSAQIFEAYAVADRLRAKGVVVAMGGLHVSVLPEEAAAHADHVIIGEGESVWPKVVQAVEAGALPRIWNAVEFAPVEALPVPRYDLLAGRPYSRFTVQTTRGCPWRCEFCASNVMLSRAYRKRPVDDVIRDVEAILKVRERPFLEFADDNTFVDKTWGKELCRRLKPYGLHWFTETDISVADDPELLTLMRESGCRQVLIGLESPNRSGLDGIELRADFKARRSNQSMEAVRMIQSHGITVNGCFILGLDGHGPEVFDQVYEFAMAAPLYDVQITVLTPFPGTPLHDRFVREGRLLERGRWDLCTLFDVNFVLKGMSADELRAGIYRLAERLYSEDSLEARRRGYFERLSGNRSNRAGPFREQIPLPDS